MGTLHFLECFRPIFLWTKTVFKTKIIWTNFFGTQQIFWNQQMFWLRFILDPPFFVDLQFFGQTIYLDLKKNLDPHSCWNNSFYLTFFDPQFIWFNPVFLHPKFLDHKNFKDPDWDILTLNVVWTIKWELECSSAQHSLFPHLLLTD